MATPYAVRNAKAIAEGYKSLYEKQGLQRKTAYWAEQAASGRQVPADVVAHLAQAHSQVYNPMPTAAEIMGNSVNKGVPGWTMGPYEGQLALPAAGQTAAAAKAVDPHLLEQVMGKMQGLPAGNGFGGVSGPSVSEQALYNSQVADRIGHASVPSRFVPTQAIDEAGAARPWLARGAEYVPSAPDAGRLATLGQSSSGQSLATLAESRPTTLMNIAERAAASTPGPGQGTIMGALNPSIPTAGAPINVINSTGQAIPMGANAASSAAGAAAGTVAPAVAAEAAGGIAPWLSWGAGAGEAGAGRLLAVGGLGGAMRAGGYGMAGMAVGGLADSLNIGGENSNYDRGISGAIRGAGIGAGVGSVVPGIGTALGAGIGGAAGAAINIFGPKHNKTNDFDNELGKQSATLAQIAQAYGLDAATTQELMNSFHSDATVAKIMGGKSPDKSVLAQQVAQYAAQIPTVQKQKMQLSQAGYNGVAMGNAIQSYIQPFMDKSSQTQKVSADYYQGLADKYASSPGIGSGYGAMAQNARNYAATSNADWAKAMSLQPTVAALAQAQAAAANPVPGFTSVMAPAVPALAR